MTKFTGIKTGNTQSENVIIQMFVIFHRRINQVQAFCYIT